MSAIMRLRALIQAKLAGRVIDVVGCVDALLAIGQELGELRCTLAPNGHGWRFQFDQEDFEINVDAARGKLRMLCARLGVLCNELDGAAISPYGGNGVVPVPGRPTDRLAVRFMNTPSQQEFVVKTFNLIEVTRGYVRLRVDQKTVKVSGEMLTREAGLPDFLIRGDSIQHWDPPYQEQAIDFPTRERILQQVRRDLEGLGRVVEFVDSIQA